MNAPIQLWYWPTPNGWKVSIALEEMGLAYEVRPVNIGVGEQFEPAFQAISPNGRMPAIVDPDGPGGAPISIFESGAILVYLAEKTGQLLPGDAKGRSVAMQWLMFQMGGVGPMAGQAHHFLKYAPAMTPPNDLPYAKNRYRDETGRLYGILNRQLERHEFVAGDFFSIADMALWPWVSLWRGQQQILDDKPNLDRWLQAVKARPAVQAGRAVAAAQRSNLQTDKKAQELLFKQR